MNLSAQFKEFLFSQASPASSVTVKNYLSDINRFISWFEDKFQKKFDPSEISNSTLKAFKNEAMSKYSASSIERNLSSLRKFFSFLKLEGHISHSPFEQSSNETIEQSDPWHIRDFKNHLYVFNASHLTIKNYVIDVKQFLSWAEKVLTDEGAWEINSSDIASRIDSSLIEEYKKRLLNEARLSPVSVNRKLSSLRRYLSWASEEGIVKPNIQVLNQAKPKLEFGSENLESSEMAQEPKFQIQNSKYSGFPPFRLLQKSKNGLIEVLDSIFIYPLTNIFDSIEHAIWVSRGRPVVQAGINQTSKINKPIKNLPKSFYAPTKISLKNFPLHRKVWHHIRNTRPEWYRRYQNYTIVSYFKFAVLILLVSVLSYAIYSNLNPKKGQTPSFAALPTAPPRVLSFQGRLTDNSDNPITSSTPLRMAIYNSLTASGAALLWQEIVTVTPDSDGIFSTILGNNTTIPQSVFGENSALWLGVTVQQTPELTPRQQIATVAYATNAETLQGLEPITNSVNTANVVLALNSSGNLVIGGSANPTFQASGGTFTVAGQVLTLQTNSGSAGNIALKPDGLGKIDLQKPIQNTTLNNNVTAAGGSVEIDDSLSVLGTTSASLVTLEQKSTGPLLSASVSGVAKFTVDNAGNVGIGGLASSSNYINSTNFTVTTGGAVTAVGVNAGSGLLQGTGGLTLTGAANINTTGTANTSIGNTGGGTITLTLGSDATGDIFYRSSGGTIARLAVGSGSQCLVGGTTPTWGSCAAGAGSNWDVASGVITPKLTSTLDLLLGGSATTSAKFAVIGINNSRGTQTASLSGSFVVDSTTGSLQSIKNQTLTIGGDTTGNINLNPNNSSSGTVFANGHLDVANHAAFGSGAAVDTADTVINLAETIAAGSATRRGILSVITVNDNSAVGAYGLVGRTKITSTGSNTALMAGINSQGEMAGTGTINDLAGNYATITVSAGGTVTRGFGLRALATTTAASASIGTAYGIRVDSAVVSAGSITNNYGVLVQAQTAGATTNYGLAVEAATTQTLWLSSNADNTTAAAGIAFGSSADTNLYRSAANTLRTDDAFNVNGTFNVSTTGVISGATGLTSSGSITFSNFTGNNASFYATAGTGALATATTSTANLCLVSNGGGSNIPGWLVCNSGLTNDIFWNQGSGALFPNNSTVDLLIGGQATTSADFAVLNVNGTGPATATVSGNLVIMQNNGAGGTLGIGLTNPSNRIQVTDLIDFSSTSSATMLGYRAGYANSSVGSVFIGYEAGFRNTSDPNTAVGYQALRSTTLGDFQPAGLSAFGYSALTSNTTGVRNSAFGYQALMNNTTSNDSSAFGYRSLSQNTGQENNAFGYVSLYSNTTGAANSAFAYRALWQNLTGSYNSAFGHRALWGNTRGSNNSAYGQDSLLNNTLGTNNIALGNLAGDTNDVGGLNLFLGYNTDASTGNLINAGAVGANSFVAINDSLILGSIGGTNSATGSARIGIGTATPSAALYVTRPINANSAALGKALAIFDQIESQDILTASASGVAKFTIGNNGNITASGAIAGLTGLTSSGSITFSNFTGNNASFYATAGTGALATATTSTANLCLVSNGGGSNIPGWLVCNSGLTNDIFWNQGSGALFPNNSTVDLLIGGQATTSAKFAVLNLAGNNLIPTATVAGNLIIMSDSGQSGIGGNLGIGTTSPTSRISVLDYIDFSSSSSATMLGYRAGYANSSVGSVFIGYEAGFRNGSDPNTAVGYQALRANTTGAFQPAGLSAFGYQALLSNTTGVRNSAFGYQALMNNTTSNDSSAFGYLALTSSTGQENSAFGYVSLFANTTGYMNSAYGYRSLWQNTTGFQNAAFGHKSLWGNTRGSNNSAFGKDSLLNTSLGTNNSAFGYLSGETNTVGGLNTLLGYNADVQAGHLINATAIGANAFVSTNDALVLGSIGGTNTATGSAKIGIGISAPTSALYVTRPINANSTALGKALAIFDQIESQDILTASAGGTTRFVIQNDGDVGIGTNLPTERLHVEGGNILIGQKTNTSAAADQTWTSVTGTAGTIGDNVTTGIASASAMAVFNGSLYVGTTKTNAAEVYRYDLTATSSAKWTKVSQTVSGTIASGGTANIDSVSTMAVWNGNLYIGTSEANSAQVYRYDGGTTWTLVSGTGLFQNLANVDTVSSMIVHDGKLMIGTTEPASAQVLQYMGGTTWFKWNNTAGTFTGATTANDGVTAMASYGTGLFFGTFKGDAQAKVWRFNSSNSITEISSTTAGLFSNVTGSGTSISSVDKVNAMTVFNGELYIALQEGNQGWVLQYVGQSGGGADSWYGIFNTDGTVVSGGTANIDGAKSLAVYNGNLYVGTEELNSAEIYRWEGSIGLFTKMSQTTAGTVAAGGSTGIDAIAAMVVYNDNIYISTYDSAEIYTQSTIRDQSYALKFHADTSGGGGIQNGLQNIGSISFIASPSGQANTGNANTGSFLVSHAIMSQSGAYDVAEDYPTRDESLEPGDLVSIETNEREFVRKSNGRKDNVIGVYSQNPAMRLSQRDATINGGKAIPVALAGRVPIKVNTLNGEISSGDYLTPSSQPGVAMKATKAVSVIGQAMEGYSGNEVGKITAYVSSSYYNGSIANTFAHLDTTSQTFSDDALAQLVASPEQTDNHSEIVTDRIVAAVDLITPKITAFSAKISELSAENLAVATDNITIAGQNLHDYISGIIDQRLGLLADSEGIVSPVVQIKGNNVVVKLPNHDSSFVIHNSSNSAVASIDSSGNASFAGRITSDSLTTNSDATISGTLRAKRIIADQIEGASNSASTNNYITNNYYSSPSAGSNQQLATSSYVLMASGSANFNSLFAQTATFEQGFMAFGPASFFEASVADRLYVGSQLSIADGAINVLGKNLELQPLRQGGVAFAGGLAEIDRDGNLRVGGKAYFADEVTIKKKLLANIIAPLPGADLVFELPEASNSATSIAVRTGTGSAILSINNKGDLTASGAGTFNKLNLNFVPEALAVSDTEVVATGSAGVVFVKAQKDEVTVKNNQISEKSLIYITPVGSTFGQQLYLLRQVPGQSFTVGISQPVSRDVKFNYLIIN